MGGLSVESRDVVAQPLAALLEESGEVLRKLAYAVDEEVKLHKCKTNECALWLVVEDGDGEGGVGKGHHDEVQPRVASAGIVEEGQEGAEREEHANHFQCDLVVSEESSQCKSKGAGGDDQCGKVNYIGRIELVVVEGEVERNKEKGLINQHV